MDDEAWLCSALLNTGLCWAVQRWRKLKLLLMDLQLRDFINDPVLMHCLGKLSPCLPSLPLSLSLYLLSLFFSIFCLSFTVQIQISLKLSVCGYAYYPHFNNSSAKERKPNTHTLSFLLWLLLNSYSQMACLFFWSLQTISWHLRS